MTDHSDKIKEVTAQYVSAASAGDVAQASAAVDTALRMGLKPLQIYLEILSPAQWQVGALWEAGRLTIADEHLATQITGGQMERLRGKIVPRPSIGARAVVTTPVGDHHALGARMVADFLYADGWTVDFLGAGTPAEDLVKFVTSRPTQLVCLSLTQPECMPGLQEQVQSLLEVPERPRILIGGRATTDTIAEAIGADGRASNAAEALSEARRLINGTLPNASLDSFLKQLGARIQQMRKQKGWSQRELAEGAGLDRTYISAVEHGKQNLSMSALLRLANALDVSVEDILITGVSSSASS